MKSITHIIIIHLAFLAFFGGTAIVFAEDLVDNDQETTRCQVLLESGEAGAEQTAYCENWLNKNEQKLENVTARKAGVEEGKSEAAEMITEKKKEVSEKKEQRRVQLQEKAQKRVVNLTANISNRIDASINRLQNIVDRLSSRIEKISKQGIDTSEAEAALASAQISVDTASKLVANIDSNVTDAVESKDIYVAWQEVKSNITEIKDHLKTAQTELRATVASLKAELLRSRESNGVREAVQEQNQNGAPKL